MKIYFSFKSAIRLFLLGVIFCFFGYILYLGTNSEIPILKDIVGYLVVPVCIGGSFAVFMSFFKPFFVGLIITDDYILFKDYVGEKGEKSRGRKLPILNTRKIILERHYDYITLTREIKQIPLNLIQVSLERKKKN